MRGLDLFCGAGGASAGYAAAGFDMVGVDTQAGLSYPYLLHVRDALEALGDADFMRGVEFVHASPPCQDHSALSRFNEAHGTGWLLEATREALEATGLPYVIENVVGAKMPGSVVLCGTHFGLSTVTEARGEVWLKRHRQFEANFPLPDPGRCTCRGRSIIGVYGTGDGGTGRGWKGSIGDRRAVMGIDWMSRGELAQAIPPAYTEFIGRAVLDARAAA